jgi:hypothetical protein
MTAPTIEPLREQVRAEIITADDPPTTKPERCTTASSTTAPSITELAAGGDVGDPNRDDPGAD